MRNPGRLITALLATATLAMLAGCGDGSSSSAEPPASGPAANECEYVANGSPAREVEAPGADSAPGASTQVTIETSAGAIGITLDADRAPCTVASFVSLAEQGYFDDTQCHRLTTSGIYVLQCGDPSASGRGGPGYSFADELDGSETYPAGTLAMANAGPNTNGSQFFLVYEDTQLPPAYTVFGQLDEAGLAVVEEIAAKGAAGGAGDGAPAEPVTITGVAVR